MKAGILGASGYTGAELLRQLVLDRLGILDEAGLVDVLDELQPHLFQPAHRLVFELQNAQIRKLLFWFRETFLLVR